MRPIRGLEERRRRDVLIASSPGAFKVVGGDRWIGRTTKSRLGTLHVTANNLRFVVIGRRAGLASRILGLSLRRQSEDMQKMHGYPVLTAATFFNPLRISGTRYHATIRLSPGMIRGFRCLPVGSACGRLNTRSKEVAMYNLQGNAREDLALFDGYRS